MQGKWNIAYFYVEFANYIFYLKMVISFSDTYDIIEK